MDANFEYAVERTLVREGIFTDHPQDHGGATKYGITAREAQLNGISDVRTLTVDQAKAIYYTDYWCKSGAVRIASKYIAAELFDSAVLHGPNTAGKFLQRAFNLMFPDAQQLAEDGIVGPLTTHSVNSALPRWEKTILNCMTGEQYIYLKNIVVCDPSQHVFFKGWVGKRLDVPDDAQEA